VDEHPGHVGSCGKVFSSTTLLRADMASTKFGGSGRSIADSLIEQKRVVVYVPGDQLSATLALWRAV